VKDGFALIEFMIIAAILGIFAAILAPVFYKDKERKSDTTTVHKGTYGTVRERCVDGRIMYFYVNSMTQKLDAQGRPIGCNE
jgi:competence protein ComGC